MQCNCSKENCKRQRQRHANPNAMGMTETDRECAAHSDTHLVDVGNALAEVELRVRAGLDALDLEERVLDHLVGARALVAKEDGLGVQADRLTSDDRASVLDRLMESKKTKTKQTRARHDEFVVAKQASVSGCTANRIEQARGETRRAPVRQTLISTCSEF